MTDRELAAAIGRAATLFASTPSAQDGVPRGSISLFGELLAEREKRRD